MAVEIKELHIKTNIKGDSGSQDSMANVHVLKEELETFCKHLVRDLLDRQKER